MSVVAAYMINSHGIHLQRYKGEKYNRWIPDEDLKRSTPDAKFTPEDSRDRAIDAFELLRTKVDVIVIVNANLHYQETVQLVAEAARDYSNSVLIITSAMAKLSKVLSSIFVDEIFIGQKINVITFCANDQNPEETNFDFFILEKTEIGFEIVENGIRQFEDNFFWNENFDFLVFVYHISAINLVENFTEKVSEYFTGRFFHRPFERYDYFLVDGGLVKGFNYLSYYLGSTIVDFSHGIEARFNSQNNSRILVPTGSPLPLTVFGIDGNYSLYYLPEIIQVHKKMVIERRLFMKKKFSFESCGKTIFHIDAHGFLSFGDPPEVSKSVLLTLTNEYVEIEVVQNGFRRVLKDINNQERTPMFFSNVRNRVSVGEFARKNLENHRKSVVYDIFKYITKPLDEVEVDPDWSFSLVQNPEANILPCFLQVDTVWGTRIVSPELILKCIISAVVKCHSHKIENSKIDFKYPGNLDLDKVISEAIEHSGKKVGSRCM